MTILSLHSEPVQDAWLDAYHYSCILFNILNQ